MSTRAVDWALRLALSPGAKLLLLVLAHHADAHGRGLISRQELNRFVGASVELTVDHRYFSELGGHIKFEPTLADEIDYQLPADACAAAAVQADLEFDTWYAPYPRKKQRHAAMRAFKRVRKQGTPLALLLSGLARSIRSWQTEKRPPEKIPYPATWLNGGGWMDADSVPTANLVDINHYLGRR